MNENHSIQPGGIGPRQNPQGSEAFTPGPKLEVALHPTSFASEQFRSLKVALAQRSEEGEMSVLQVTSPDMMDGKSLICANLAYCFAADPERSVVLVDCDLRFPGVSPHFGIAPSPGLVDYLSDTSRAPKLPLQQAGRLCILPAGKAVENPVELLMSARMRSLLDRLREEFDTIILDSPPLQPITDGRLLASLADGTLLVIRRGKTPYDSVEKAIRLLGKQSILGAVFNDVRPLRFNTYYNHRLYSGSAPAYSAADSGHRDEREQIQ